MSVDVLTFPELVRAEKQILQYSSDREIGRFNNGQEESYKIGDGLEIDGLRDYVPGDEARHIDWIASAKRTDGGLLIRQHYAEQMPLTVVISDIPTDNRYAETPGNPLSARSLGFVVGYSVLKSAVRLGGPVYGVWTDGFVSGYKPRGLEGPKAPERIISAGLSLAARSTELALQMSEPQKKSGLLRRKIELPEFPEKETLAEVINRTAEQTKLIADAARFIIVSDFRSGTHEVMQAMRTVGKRSDVVTVQITNPLLRELPSDVSVFQGSKQGIIIESNQQRVLYAQKAAEKQAKIDDQLKRVSTKTVTIDTMHPRLAVARIA